MKNQDRRVQEVEPFSYSGLGQDATGWWPISAGPDVLQLSQSCHNRDITGSLFWGKCSLSGSTLVMKRCSRMAGLSHCPSNISLCPVLPGREMLQPFVLGQLLQTYLGISLLSYYCACPFPHLSCPPKTKLDSAQGIFFKSSTQVQPRWSGFIGAFSDKEYSANNSFPHQPKLLRSILSQKGPHFL